MSFPASDHCNGKTFFYPGGPPLHGLLDVLRWKLGAKPARWPSHVELVPQPSRALTKATGVVATWINHATFLLETSRGNFLTDPVFSDRCSPVSWAGPRRCHAPGIAFADLPKIDGVLLSHDHYDHCDFPSLRKLAAQHDPLVIAPLGHAALLADAGLKRVIELDWWQTHAWAEDAAITLTPSRHWCRRRMGDTNQRLWGGFFLNFAGHRVYFLGDSGYEAALFTGIKERLGAPDLSCIPIGAYEPRWFMESSHMNPAEALQTHRDLGSRLSVAMHWGTFQLTDEGRDDPPWALAAAQSAEPAGSSRGEFRLLTPGESVVA